MSLLRLPLLLVALMGLVVGSAHAACSSPDGQSGDIGYASNYGVMAYCNGTNWVSMAGGVSVTVGGSTGATTMDELTDATITTPATGQYLTYSGGGQWVNTASPLGTITDTKWCVGNSSGQVVCNTDAPITVESDPQVGTLTNTKWCTTDGTAINCGTDAPVTTEVDPQLDTLTANLFCQVNAGGTALVCANTAATQRTALELGTMAIQNANAVAISGGSISGLTSLSVAGIVTASFFEGDGSRLTGLAAGADNMGDHTATRDVLMGAYNISGTGYVSATAFYSGDGAAYFYNNFVIPSLVFDTNDYLRYTRATNMLDVMIGGTSYARVTSGGISTTTLTADVVTASTVNGQYASFTTLYAGSASATTANVGSLTASGIVTASFYEGNGSRLTGISAGASALSGLTDVTISNVAGRDYLRYDSASSKWVNISESTAMSTTTMVSGWPDAIQCVDGVSRLTLLQGNYAPSGGGIAYETANSAVGGSRYYVIYTSAGAYSTNSNLTTSDCVTNAWSISQLYAQGRAFNFIGGSGGATPAGADTNVQYNSGGSALGAEAAFAYNATTDRLSAVHMDASGGISASIISATNAVNSLYISGTNIWGGSVTGNVASVTTINSRYTSATQGYIGALTGSTAAVGGLTVTGASSQANVSITNLIQLSNSAQSCSTGISGTLRYSPTSSTVEYCNSSAWVSMGPSDTQVVSFYVHKNGTDQTGLSGWTKLTFSTEDYDTNNNFASSRFTATVPGKYLLRASSYCSGGGTQCEIGIYKNGVRVAGGFSYQAYGAPQVSTIINMSANDYAEVFLTATGSTVASGNAGYTNFSGAILGPQAGGGGGSTPAGSTNDVQFNSSSALAADTGNFTYASSLLTAPNAALGAGSAANPSLRFSTDTNTGLYSVAGDTLGISVGGAELLRFGPSGISSTVKAYVPIGSAAAPAYSFSTDTDTGLYSPYANVLGFSVGGTDVARVSSVGVSVTGIVTATYFEGNGSRLSNLPAATAASSTGAIQFNVANALAGDGANLFWDDANDRLGVGTGSPQGKFQVNADSAYNAGSGLRVQSSDSNYILGYISADNSGDAVTLQSYRIGTGAGVKPLLLNPQGGNVGIGTVAPSAKLEVAASTVSASIRAGTLMLQSYGADNEWISQNIFYDSGWKYAANGYGIRQYFLNGDYYFATAPSNASGSGAAATVTTRLFVGNTGNVGIGTVTPGTTLGVTGSISATVNVTAAAFLYSSDKRLKKDIIALTGGLAKLDAINPVSFRFISDTTQREHLGVIAQDVQSVYPQAVVQQGDRLSVDYPALVAPLISALKELKVEVMHLKATNDNLQQRVKVLEADKALMQ